MPEAAYRTIDVDEVMERIRERVRARREERAGQQAAILDEAERALSTALEHAHVGASLPPMHRQSGVQRLVAASAAKVFLRLAQLVTRDQRAFNQSILDAARALFDHGRAQATELAQARRELRELAVEVAGLRARLAEPAAPDAADPR